jgi:hypothetical protein
MVRPVTIVGCNFKTISFITVSLVLFFVIAGVVITVCFKYDSKQAITTDSTQKSKTVAEVERRSHPDFHIPSTVIEPEVLQVNSLRFVMDPREELLSIVLLQSDYDPSLEQMTKFDFNYKREIATTFHEYKNHDVVSIFNKLWRINFAYDAPPTAVLYMTIDFRLREDTQVTSF